MTATPSSISLSSIVKTGDNPPPPRILIYGPEKIGKSTFGAGAPNPIFLPTEDGLNAIRTNAFPLATSFDDVLKMIDELYTQPHDFRTAVVDSLDWLETLIWRHVCNSVNPPKASIEEFGYGKGYVEALTYWRMFMSGLLALRDHRGMASILIAHAQIKRFDAPDKVASYDRYQPKLHAAAGAIVKEAVDIIGFANEEATIVSTDVGFNQKKAKAVGGGRRVLHLGGRPAFLAGSRFRLPPEVDLSWDAFAAAYSAAIAPPTPAAQQ